MPRENLTQGLALLCLLLMGGFAVAGPSGLLAWSENRQLLDQRRAEVDRLMAERDVLRNRVNLLEPSHVDPDLAGELLRRKLNVINSDELVIMLR